MKLFKLLSALLVVLILVIASFYIFNKFIPTQLPIPKKVILEENVRIEDKTEKSKHYNPFYDIKGDTNIIIWVNLPEYKLRYYENGKLKDSSKLIVGHYFAPILEKMSYELIVRPCFYPTPLEIENGYKYMGPEQSDEPEIPKNPMGRRKIILQDIYRIHGTNEPHYMGRNVSSGCTRAENKKLEEITDSIIKHLPIKKKTGKIGQSEYYTFTKPFRILQSYRLWNDLTIKDSILEFRAFKDIHRRLDMKATYGKAKVDLNVQGNAFLKEHLYLDLSHIGYNFNSNDDSLKMNKFWQQFLNKLRINKTNDTILTIKVPF
ncbi:MAG: L,D-transpeptidase [Candidatus Kapabacteria bacterium]|nr:L,D-transpeptidase [Candidatus Kapabacteria bacterium]